MLFIKQNCFFKYNQFNFIFITYSNLSLIYAHCVHRKLRKDMRGTKYTYCNGYFLIFLLIKSTLKTFPLLEIRLFIYKYENKK